MLKKAIPIFLVSGLVLGGCSSNDAVPKNNETPMEDPMKEMQDGMEDGMDDMKDRERNWTPNSSDDQQGGANLDGMDDNRDMDGKGKGTMDGTNTSPNETIIEDGDNNTKKGDKNKMNR